MFKTSKKLYDYINDSQKLNINDINHILINYSKENSNIELLRKFIELKN